MQSAHLLDSQSVSDDIYKDLRNVARMCMGMAIECYFKALYLANGNTLHDGKQQERFGAHSLAKMAKIVSFPITEDQEKVLHYLSVYVRVKGRYPVPLTINDMELHSSDKSRLETHAIRWEPKSDYICNDMVRRLETCIAAARAKLTPK